MRIALVLTLLSCSLFAADGEVKITYAAPKVGDKVVRSVHNEMSVKLNVKGGEREFTNAYGLEETTKIAITVLDAGKVAATKVKAEYLKDDHSASGPQGPERESQIVEGKAYVVANTRTGMEIYLANEKQYAPPEEAELVVLDFADLGRMPRLTSFFADRTFKIGEKLEVVDKAAQMLFSDAGTLSNLTLTLREVKNEGGTEAAIFDIAVNFERNDGYLTYTTPLKGEIAVAVKSALPIRLNVSGEMKVAGTKPAEGLLPEKTAEGKGTMKYSLANEATPAAK